MKIYKMTATFGKLRHEELCLEEGLNIITAPNEWGKSTWCAFLVAMLYGIETGARANKSGIPDKTRYAPWSGEPMSGSMDIQWNGRDITIQRISKGRTPMGEFRAFETVSGIAVPELTGDNCGLKLLGVEKSVFLRSGFLKLSDLPITQDDALRRRLNALVTTGDESGASDNLVQSLKELKNKCRHNKTGKLPEAEKERAEIVDKLEQMEALNAHTRQIRSQQEALNEQHILLQNHLDALEYASARDYAEKYTRAQMVRDQAADELARWEDVCRDLPDEDAIGDQLQQLYALREKQDALRTEIQTHPPVPDMPDPHSVFRGMDPEQAVVQASADEDTYRTNEKGARSKLFLILCALFGVPGVIGLLLSDTVFRIAGIALLAVAVVCAFVHFTAIGKKKTVMAVLAEKYRPLPPGQWEDAARTYLAAHKVYENELQGHRESLAVLNERLRILNEDIAAFTGGSAPAAYEEMLRDTQEKNQNLAAAHKALIHAQSVVDALKASQREVLPPRAPDRLSLTKEETEAKRQELLRRQGQLQNDLGACMGRIEALGQEEELQTRLNELDNRIFRLEETNRALEIALEAAEHTKVNLQKRFAPRISERTRKLFSAFTGGRYDRLKLEEDLTLSVAAEQEDTVQPSIYRSDGTVDQLYLALRLAVAQELTPDAPFILDDALVRFDDDRLQKAISVLERVAEDKQILLFSCQTREEQAAKG